MNREAHPKKRILRSVVRDLLLKMENKHLEIKELRQRVSYLEQQCVILIKSVDDMKEYTAIMKEKLKIIDEDHYILVESKSRDKTKTSI